MRKTAFLLAVVIAVSLVLTACGASKPSTTIDVQFTDFHFVPDSFTVPAGAEITLNATNTGSVVHQFVIMKYGTTVGDNFGDEDIPNIYWRMEAQPGESKTATFTAPSEPGEYQVVCGTPGHFLAGMVASLTVVAP